MNDMTVYKGAWLYPVDGGWEANLRGFHYSADTVNELKSKIDCAVSTDDPGRTLKLYSADPKYYNTMNEAEEEGPQWAVQYQLQSPDVYDDELSDNSIQEVIITAIDFSAASKYAEQYGRAQAHENDLWKGAEIISIVQK